MSPLRDHRAPVDYLFHYLFHYLSADHLAPVDYQFHSLFDDHTAPVD